MKRLERNMSAKQSNVPIWRISRQIVLTRLHFRQIISLKSFMLLEIILKQSHPIGQPRLLTNFKVLVDFFRFYLKLFKIIVLIRILHNRIVYFWRFGSRLRIETLVKSSFILVDTFFFDYPLCVIFWLRNSNWGVLIKLGI